MSKFPALESMPQHVGFIMDGNGRWAKKRLLPRSAGHKAGVGTLKKMVSECGRYGIKALTAFAFSSENWLRPEEEVGFLMKLIIEALKKELQALYENGVRFNVIGDISDVPNNVRSVLENAMDFTKENDDVIFTVAINYGGRWDIVESAKKLCQQVVDGTLKIADMDEQAFANQLSTHDLPPLDLLIRTSGEVRLSNFLLWQAAYSELYFCDAPWPSFDEHSFHQALSWYADRQRRFGRTSEQLGHEG